ncbi:MAG: glutamine-hydrolyzing carbamoyl-phosphate synthase small subunit [Chloroflexi bacterium]|nr:glutamine-hydrolyzing carbamoyl-phosphate synthase small subunit [Chloroflexota bacterium]
MLLALEDGAVYEGTSFGAPVEATGEVVFNTGMTGYQEICTDPSYRGQMVVLTYPIIGSYGVTPEDAESRRPWLAALIVREYCDGPSNWRAGEALGAYLARHDVPAIAGVDTRALTRRLRATGALRAALGFAEAHSGAELVEQARAVPPLAEQDLVAETTLSAPRRAEAGSGPRLVLVDCGNKENIIRSLARRGAEIVVLPFDAPPWAILRERPDGIVVSNGPGDPAALDATVATIRDLLQRGVPLFGICLGHQLLGRAIGARTSRLPFGHHGGNHPVKDLLTGEVHITSQNHEFQVEADSVPPESGFFVSMINLNDRSVEGLAHRALPVFSVQYHPEGSPGPQDNQYLFDRFLALVAEQRQQRGA